MKKQIKRLIALTLVVLLILGMVPLTTAAGFAGGNGTAGNPWRIATAAQLEQVNNNLNAHYRLTANLTAATDFMIGSFATPFEGSFDGGGFTIAVNITSTESIVGLFRMIGAGGVVRNLTVTGDVTGVNNVGGFAGRNDGLIQNSRAIGPSTITGEIQAGGLLGRNDGIVENSYATGDVTGDANVGGFVGAIVNGSIINSHATGNVVGPAGSNGVGGLVGLNLDGTVQNSHATGGVEGHDNVGGLIGWNTGIVRSGSAIGAVTGAAPHVGGLIGANDGGTIENSHAAGNVTSTAFVVGGLVGNNMGGTIENSHATGNVTGTGGAAGGLVGTNSPTHIIKNSFATGDVAGQNIIGGLVALNQGTIEHSYATGDVTATNTGMGVTTGGLVGTNLAIIENSVAVNDSVTGGGGVEGRVWGWGPGTGNDNFAYEAMLVSGSTVAGGTATNQQGADVSAPNTAVQTWWETTVGFDFTAIWYWDSGRMLPSLRPVDVAATGVMVNPSTLTMNIGNTQPLTATVTPFNATNQNVTWGSSNGGVATVSAGGVVTAVSAGTATITVTTVDGGHTATAAVTVTRAGGGGGTPPQGPEPDEFPFIDVPEDHWAREYVEFVWEEELKEGVSDTLFAPEDTLSRAMAATVLWRMAGEPEADGGAVFSDVADGRWYTDAIAWAHENSVVLGVGGNRFDPAADVTREQFAAMMYRYTLFVGGDAEVSDGFDLYHFADRHFLSYWAEVYMYWANYNELITGVTATTLVPQGNATRSQSAAILTRFVAAFG